MAKYENVIRDASGEVIEGAGVQIFDAGTTTPSSLFSDAALSAAETNPLTTDADGKYSFYVASGLYKIIVSKTGFSTFTTDNVQIGTTDDVWSFETNGSGDAVIRDVSLDRSAFRIEDGAGPDSLVLATNGNVSLIGDNDASDGEGIVVIGEVTTAPSGNPTGGVFLWVEDDELQVKYPSGDAFQLGPFLENQIPYYGEYHPDKPMPNADREAPQSDEFIDGGTASWVWGNQGGATLTSEMDTVRINVPASATDDVHCRLLSYAPAGDFVTFAKFSSTTEATNNYFGIALLTGTAATPTEIVTCGVRRDTSVMDLAAGVATSYTSLGSLSLNQFSASHLERGFAYVAASYDHSAKEVTTFGSTDGLTWMELSVVKVMTDHPDFIGIFGNSESASAFAFRCHWIRTSEDSSIISGLVTGR